MSRRSTRWINGCSLVTTLVLAFAFLSYLLTGAFLSLRPVTLPLIVVLITVAALAFFQIRVAWIYEGEPFHRPVPFRWVMALWFSSLLTAVAWALATRYSSTFSRDGDMAAVVWYQLAFASIWFLRRFLTISRDPEHINVHGTPHKEQCA